MKKIINAVIILLVIAGGNAWGGYNEIKELKVEVIVSPDIKNISRTEIKEEATSMVQNRLPEVTISKGAPDHFIEIIIGGFEKPSNTLAFVFIRLTGSGEDAVDSFTKVYFQKWRYFKGDIEKVKRSISGFIEEYIVVLSKKWQ